MSYVCPTCRSLIPGEPPAAPREDVEALVNDLEDAICNLSSDDYNQAAGIIYKVRRALRSRTQEPRDVWRERWNDLYQRMSNMATAPGDDGEYGVAFLCTMLDVKRSIGVAPSEEAAHWERWKKWYDEQAVEIMEQVRVLGVAPREEKP